MILTHTELANKLRQAGIPAGAVRVLDRTFQTIERNEVENLFAKWIHFLPDDLVLWRTLLGETIERRLPVWLDSCWDCDNHSADFMTFCCRSNAYTCVKTGKPRGGLAVGKLCYQSMGNGRVGPHAINVFITEDGSVRFFEPADGQEIYLIKREIETTWDAEFI